MNPASSTGPSGPSPRSPEGHGSLEDITLHRDPRVLRPQPHQLRPLVLGQFALLLPTTRRVHPIPQRSLLNAQITGHSRDRLLRLQNDTDSAFLELPIEPTTRFHDNRLTLCSRCSPRIRGETQERVLFALVANRAIAPMWKLSAAEWVSEDVVIPGLAGMDEDQAYRAMDLLGPYRQLRGCPRSRRSRAAWGRRGVVRPPDVVSLCVGDEWSPRPPFRTTRREIS